MLSKGQRHLTGVASLLLVTASTGCAMGLKHSAVVDGANHSYVLEGSGAPTVVFEAGLGNDLGAWAPVFSDVASHTRAFAYSRAGYSGIALGGSQLGSRDADDVARRLHKILSDRDVSGPFVLVGHSVGGNYVLRFAALYPEEVAGVVLVDGRPRAFAQACKARGLGPCSPPAVLQAAAPPHVAAEMRGLADAEEQTPRPHELGSIPVTVIAATEPPLGASAEIQAVWLQEQRRFADGLEHGRYVVAEGSGHFVQKDAPDLVLREILAMVDRVRD